MDIPEIALSVRGSEWLVVLLLLAGVGATWWYYRRTTPPLPRFRRIVLAVLRGLALLVLILLIFEPVVSLTRNITKRPRVAVLIDDTASMAVADRLGDRRAQVQAILETDALARLESRYDVTRWRFAMSPEVLPDGDTLTFRREGTDIARTLELLNEQSTAPPPDAILLISDGSYTTGENPVRTARRIGIPIHAIGIGDSLAPRDALVINVQANELAYVGAEIPVAVTIAGHQLRGEKTTLTLTVGRQVLHTEIVEFPEDGRETVRTIMLTPDAPGSRIYRVSLAPVDGELTDQNNHREFAVRVLERKIQVTVMAGRPDAEVAFLRRVFDREEDFEATVFVERDGGALYHAGPAELSRALDLAQVVVLVDYPTSETAGNLRQAVAAHILNRQLPVWILTGPQWPPAKRDWYQRILSYQFKTYFNEERLIFPQLQDAGHPAVRLRELFADNTEVWRRLPPIFSQGWMLLPGENAIPLVAIDNARSRIAETTDTLPLIYGQRRQGRKVMVWNGYGFWRWRLMLQDDAEHAGLYGDLVRRTLRWLMNREDEQLVRISVDKELYRSGETIYLTAQVYTEEFQPLDGAEVRVSIHGSNGDIERVLDNRGFGRYTARLEVLEPGDYTVNGSADYAGRALGNDATQFTIGAFSVEMIDTRLNQELLVRLSAETGGRYAPAAAAEDLIRSLTLPITSERRTDETHLWNLRALVALLVAALALEWLLRKRWGLL